MADSQHPHGAGEPPGQPEDTRLPGDWPGGTSQHGVVPESRGSTLRMVGTAAPRSASADANSAQAAAPGTAMQIGSNRAIPDNAGAGHQAAQAEDGTINTPLGTGCDQGPPKVHLSFQLEVSSVGPETGHSVLARITTDGGEPVDLRSTGR